MNLLYMSPAVVGCFDNDNDATIVEHWAMESIVTLTENAVMANRVHRDFTMDIAQHGDVVNTRKPGNFRAQRKTDADPVVAQDASSTNVPVPLDQHHYVTFVIKDGEASKSFKDLREIYLVPAMQTEARALDRSLLGQVPQFLRSGSPTLRAGRLGAMSSSNAKDWVLEAGEIMNRNLAPLAGRSLVLSPSSLTAMLATELFVSADKRGDGGTALEMARLGHILGFETYMDQNVSAITTGADTVTGTVTGAEVAGETGSITVDVQDYAVIDGEFVVIAGNDQPTWATAATDNGTDTTAVTLNEALKYATEAAAVITVYKACAVKGGYAAGYTKEIVLDGWGAAPQVGQMIAFGTGSGRHVYTIIESYLSASGEQSVLLDRPLAIALTNDDSAFPGPYGSLNFAFHRNALALVTRPLATPNNAFGVQSTVVNADGFSVRATMQYDGLNQGTRVTLDFLSGSAVLDVALGTVLLG